MKDVLNVLKEFLPTFTEKNFKDEVVFLKTTKVLGQEYIKELCKTVFNTIPVKREIIWLETIFFVRGLLHSLYGIALLIKCIIRMRQLVDHKA